jgi:hypothetical protein
MIFQSSPQRLIILTSLLFKLSIMGQGSHPLNLTDFQIFSEQHCLACHDSATSKGGFDLETLPTDLNDPETLRKWIRLFDQIDQNEMPPQKQPQPQASEKSKILKNLSQQFIQFEKSTRGLHRTPIRRLSNLELSRSIEHLLGPISLPIEFFQETLPVNSFDTEVSALGISPDLLETWNSCIDLAVEQVFNSRGKSGVFLKPKTTTILGHELSISKPADSSEETDPYLYYPIRKNNTEIQIFGNIRVPFSVGASFKSKATQTGWYQITYKHRALNSTKPISYRIASLPLFQASNTIPSYVFKSALSQEFTNASTWLKMKKGELVKFELSPSNTSLGFKGVDPENKKGFGIEFMKNHQGLGLGIDDITITGPHEIPEDKEDQQSTLTQLIKKVPNWQSPKHFPELLTRFTKTACRCSQAKAEEILVPTLKLALENLNQPNADPTSILKNSLKKILLLPEFLFINPPKFTTTTANLATRLSLVLQAQTPTQKFFDQAHQLQINKIENFIPFVEQVLQSPQSLLFFQRLADHWLMLREINATSPDTKIAPSYEYHLEHSILQETKLYLQTAFIENWPISQLINGKVAILNQRLADHYKIKDIPLCGDEFVRVELPTSSNRAGLLSQASILKISANGSNTSPILRGVWILNHFLDESPPPPPANVKAIEPNLRGATTIKEQLAQHQTGSCASCHKKIDHLGIALEGFGVIGEDRPFYPTFDENKKRKRGPAVDSSSQFYHGDSFKNYEEFCQQLATQEERLASALARRLIAFSTGKKINFSERSIVDQIVKNTAPNGYRLRDLLLQVLQNPLFQSP